MNAEHNIKCSINADPKSPYWFVSYTGPDGKQKRRSTKVPVAGGFFQGEKLSPKQAEKRALIVGAQIAEAEYTEHHTLDNTTVREINAGQYALCVSLHCDSAQTSGARGAHAIYVSDKGGRAAEAIAAHLCPIMPGRANRTVRRQNLYILNNTRCPAVLVECGFLTNSRDADMLRYEGRRVALAIAVGVEEFLNA